MKRKLKDFLNKRVISGTLSAAIAFNMAAYIPMSAFAHYETSAETTVDLTETETLTKYEYLLRMGKLLENINVEELSEQYVTIISVVEN